ARGRGKMEGIEAGRAEALEAFERQRLAAEEVIAAIGRQAELEIAGAEDLVIGLAFEAVCKVLGKQLVSREAVGGVVRQLLARVRQEEPVIVRLHPQDHELLCNDAGEVAGVDGKWMKVELIPDEGIVLGGCLVETARGNLDARIETQLQSLRE